LGYLIIVSRNIIINTVVYIKINTVIISDGTTKCQRLDVQGCRGRGRPKKTWELSVKCDIRKYGMQRVEPFDKDKWRSSCGSNRPTRASMEKRTL